MFVWWGGGEGPDVGGGGGGAKTLPPPPPPHTNVCNFSQLCQTISSLTYYVSLSNLVILQILR